MREARGPAWTDWLLERSIGAVRDRHALTRRHLRERGAMRAAVVIGDCSVDEALSGGARPAVMEGRALASEVSTRDPYVVRRRPCRVAVVDYGCKRSIVAGSSRPVRP
jgi:carbamoylphosphate synthase small subunit